MEQNREWNSKIAGQQTTSSKLSQGKKKIGTYRTLSRGTPSKLSASKSLTSDTIYFYILFLITKVIASALQSAPKTYSTAQIKSQPKISSLVHTTHLTIYLRLPVQSNEVFASSVWLSRPHMI